MQPVINNQIVSLKESATLFINQLALKLRSEGQNICHLGFGESPFPVPEPMRIISTIVVCGSYTRGTSTLASSLWKSIVVDYRDLG